MGDARHEIHLQLRECAGAMARSTARITLAASVRRIPNATAKSRFRTEAIAASKDPDRCVTSNSQFPASDRPRMPPVNPDPGKPE